jgi:hypothetical protein
MSVDRSDADGWHPIFSLSYVCKHAIFRCLTDFRFVNVVYGKSITPRFAVRALFFGEFRPSVPIFRAWGIRTLPRPKESR